MLVNSEFMSVPFAESMIVPSDQARGAPAAVDTQFFALAQRFRKSNGLRLMPKIERWENLPESVRRHLIDRMRDRAVSIADLSQLGLWMETRPQVPDGQWYKDSLLSSFAVAERSPRHSFSLGKRLKVKPSDKKLRRPAHVRNTSQILGVHRQSKPHSRSV